MKNFILALCCCISALAVGCKAPQDLLSDGTLPREAPSEEMAAACEAFIAGMEADSVNLHSVMVVQHGKVTFEKWFGEEASEKPHALWSVSKTFTSMAVGFAIAEGKLNLDDKVISFFPDELPAEVSENLAAMTIRDLLTMTCGHDKEPNINRLVAAIRSENDTIPASWAKTFLAHPVPHTPGTYYCYNSYGTYMLSVIITKVTGEKVRDYLMPRLFEPLCIEAPVWEEDAEGYNTGGWGLNLTTESLAKMGLLMLHDGVWNGKQLLPKGWVVQASAYQVPCVPAGVPVSEVPDSVKAANDWVQGYGYQMWRCRHNAFRADGAGGQFILVIPDHDAVVALTAWTANTQKELNLVWDNLLPVL